MKKTFMLISILILCVSSFFAQEYIMNDGAAYSSLTGTTTIITLTGGDWDSGYYDMALSAGNQFYFYGKKVTHIRIWTNGYVTFGFGSAPADYSDNSNDPLPSSSNPDGYAAPGGMTGT